MKLHLASTLVLSSLAALSFATNHSTTSHAGTNNKPTNDAKPIAIAPNQDTLELNLKANATTGYGWFLNKYPTQYLTLKSYHYLAPNNGLMGAPGKAVFTFDVKPEFHKAPYLTHIYLTYMRPWDDSTATPKVLTVISIPKPAAKSKAVPVTKLMEPGPVVLPNLSDKQIDQGINKVATQTQKSEKTSANQKHFLSITPTATAPVKAAKPAAPKDPNNWLTIEK